MDVAGIAAFLGGLLGVARFNERAFHVTFVACRFLCHVAVAIVHRQDGFADLCCKICTRPHAVEAAVIAPHVARHTVHHPAVHHHQIQNGANAFCVLARPRVCDHFYAFHHGCGHGFQDFLGVFRHTGVEVAVLVNLVVAASFHEDVLLAINSHHRHFAQQVKHVLCS